MADSTLARDNLFQLNVLLWACSPQPASAPVTPVLFNAGYGLWSVEQPLDAGVAELARLRSAAIDIRPNPVVDVVLHQDTRREYVLVECKPSSFGIGSEWAPQARGIIVAGGNAAARLGLSGHLTAEACYLVPAEDAGAVDRTLLELAGQVAAQGLPTCSTAPIGLSLRADGVYLGLPSNPQGTSQMPRSCVPEKRVVAVQSDEDPRPLYIIPWIPDAPEETDLTAFREKVRSELLARLGRGPVGSQLTFTFEELLDAVTRGVFRYWRDRDSLTGRVFPMLGQLLGVLLGDDPRASVGRREMNVNVNTEKDQQELMERVRTAALPQKLPEGIQLPMEGQT